MRAVVIREPGGPDVLQLRTDVSEPLIGPADVLVRVQATAVNRADLLQRRGHYPAPAGVPPDVPGLEFAGVVEDRGVDATRLPIGARVMGLVAGGGYAEYVAVNEAELLPVPAALTIEEAAAIPEAYLTAHDAMFTQASLRPGEAVLIHGVGSGVGCAAVQLAAARGARVFGTSRSAWKLERAGALGVAVAIDTTREDFADAVLRDTDGKGTDVIIDLVGGNTLPGNLRALAPLGRLIIVGLVAGAKAELDMRLVLRKRLLLRGTVMRSRTSAERAAVVSAFRADALWLFESGRIRPVIHAVLPMADAPRAHQLLEANENFGKVVLTW
jgi:putative PIG3 family NAD(P)H quinone oxidoreductase